MKQKLKSALEPTSDQKYVHVKLQIQRLELDRSRKPVCIRNGGKISSHVERSFQHSVRL